MELTFPDDWSEFEKHVAFPLSTGSVGECIHHHRKCIGLSLLFNSSQRESMTSGTLLDAEVGSSDQIFFAVSMCLCSCAHTERLRRRFVRGSLSTKRTARVYRDAVCFFSPFDMFHKSLSRELSSSVSYLEPAC